MGVSLRCWTEVEDKYLWQLLIFLALHHPNWRKCSLCSAILVSRRERLSIQTQLLFNLPSSWEPIHFQGEPLHIQGVCCVCEREVEGRSHLMVLKSFSIYLFSYYIQVLSWSLLQITIFFNFFLKGESPTIPVPIQVLPRMITCPS